MIENVYFKHLAALALSPLLSSLRWLTRERMFVYRRCTCPRILPPSAANALFQKVQWQMFLPNKAVFTHHRPRFHHLPNLPVISSESPVIHRSFFPDQLFSALPVRSLPPPVVQRVSFLLGIAYEAMPPYVPRFIYKSRAERADLNGFTPGILFYFIYVFRVYFFAIFAAPLCISLFSRYKHII